MEKLILSSSIYPFKIIKEAIKSWSEFAKFKVEKKGKKIIVGIKSKEDQEFKEKFCNYLIYLIIKKKL